MRALHINGNDLLLEDLREVPVDEEELKITKNFMIGTILGELDGPFQVLSRWKNLLSLIIQKNE